MFLKDLRPKGTILLDIPLKGKVEGFFRPLERAMQRVGIPCRPSKNALMKGRRLSSMIEEMGFKAIEIYPYEFYKFYCLLIESPMPSRGFIDTAFFRRFFPPYKRNAEKGIKNAERVIKRLLSLLNLDLVKERITKTRPYTLKWDIYDSIFGAIAGYFLLKGSPWSGLMRDETGSEILLLSDENLRNLLEAYI